MRGDESNEYQTNRKRSDNIRFYLYFSDCRWIRKTSRKLTPDKEYRLIRRSCYCVLMEDSEVEVALPDFIPISSTLV